MKRDEFLRKNHSKFPQVFIPNRWFCGYLRNCDTISTVFAVKYGTQLDDVAQITLIKLLELTNCWHQTNWYRSVWQNAKNRFSRSNLKNETGVWL